MVDALNSFGPQAGLSIREVLTTSVAAMSVGVVDGEERLDLEYVEDRDADVDLNLVATGDGQLIEVRGAAKRRLSAVSSSTGCWTWVKAAYGL